ncbi:MAG: phosphoribosylanthranilate isomerase [Gammaproteobacteria bacterium]
MRARIKFCGITRSEDAEAAVRLGVDAIGLVLAPDSPRFLQLPQAAIIRRRLPPFVQAVALFRNASFGDVMRALDELSPDLLQFHGDEDPGFCESFSWPYLRAVPMRDVRDLGAWEHRYASASALLLDAHGAGEAGGQGRTFDWSAIKASRPYVLAGGLTPQNVGAAVRAARPYAVDVSSGIEQSPGIKDEARMRQFVEAVRAADET